MAPNSGAISYGSLGGLERWGAGPLSAPGPGGPGSSGAPLRRLLWPLGTFLYFGAPSSNQQGSTEQREGWGLGPVGPECPVQECLVIPKYRKEAGR